uniref:Uncharacterized protein n=1 Tax=Lepeophtheirus salmonis TaxID=72036 RepID=A0A0K2V0J7_LEPSM
MFNNHIINLYVVVRVKGSCLDNLEVRYYS